MREVQWFNFFKQEICGVKKNGYNLHLLNTVYKKYEILFIKLLSNKSFFYNKILAKLNISDSVYNFIFVDGVLVSIDSDLEKSIIYTSEPSSSLFSENLHCTSMILNQATYIEDFCVKIIGSAALKKPLQITYVHTEASNHKLVNYRNIVYLSKHSKCEIYENFVCTGDKYSGLVVNTKFILESYAHCRYDIISCPKNNKLVLTNTLLIMLKLYSKFDCLNIIGDNTFTKFDFLVYLQERYSTFLINSISNLVKASYNIYGIYIYHYASQTVSDVKMKTVLAGSSKVDFFIKGYVFNGISNIYLSQDNRTIQLSNTSAIKVLPELEIYTDSVTCSHAATISTINIKAIFYLYSRGIVYDKISQLLLNSFIKSIVFSLNRPNHVVRMYVTIINKILLQNKIMS
jgi:Fe-S cluster assembly scaffold protein SufB